MLKFVKFNTVRLLQPENILLMLATFDVSKPLISSSAKDEQPENIPDILLTLDVLKFEKFNGFKLLIPPNIPAILVTLDVSNNDTSKFIIFLQL